MLEIQSVTHAMNILSLFSPAEPDLGVSDIAQRLNMSKATVARLLYTLELSGILIRSKDKRKYQLGYKIIEMSSICLAKNRIKLIALPYMRELRRKFEENIDLSILYEHRRILLERIEGDYEVRARDIQGKPALLQAGATGKLFLAFLPEAEREQLIDEMELVKFTSNTIMNKQELRQQLEIIRTQGYSCCYEELTEMVNSIAAPIYDDSGKVVAALSIWGLVTHFPREMMVEYASLLVGAGKRISTELGYQGL